MSRAVCRDIFFTCNFPPDLINSMQQRLFVLLILLTGFWACKKDSDSSIPHTNSNVNVFSLIDNVQFKYDIKLDTTLVGTIGPGENTGYHGFQARRYNMNIYHAGMSDLLGSVQVSLRNGHNYSVFLSVDHTGGIIVRTVDDIYTLPQKGYSLLRLVDQNDSYYNPTSLGFGSPLIFDYVLDDSVVVFPRLNYQAITQFIAVPAGVHPWDVRWTDSTLTLLPNRDTTFNFEDGKVYSWIIYGTAPDVPSYNTKSLIFTHNP